MMTDEKQVSRRKFLKVAGGLMGAGVLACGGTAYFGLKAPSSVAFPETSCGEDSKKKLLLAYASKCGTTAAIADAIGRQLCSGGFAVDIQQARHVSSLEGYRGVILGSAVYMGSLLRDATRFAEDLLAAQSDMPVVFFNVCLEMKDESPESVQTALGYLDPLREVVVPSSVASFAGRIDLATLPPLYRLFAQADTGGILAEGDYRDWQKIAVWAEALVKVF
jgi:menaquinone-dependent protoporphyrinogen oxidase